MIKAKVIPLQAPKSYSIMVLDRALGTKLLELNFNGSLNESQASLIAMACSMRNIKISDLIFVKEVHDTRFVEQLNNIAATVLEAKKLYINQVRLTKRETQVLTGVIRGEANKEIAHGLNISERTVKFHVSTLLSKFGVRGRGELMLHHMQRVLRDPVAGVAAEG